MQSSQVVRRILLIEPDESRARVLKDLLGPWEGIHVEVVPSVAAAIRSMDSAQPDLVMTPTFMAPADEAALTAHVRRMPGSRLPIVDLPYFIETGEEGAANGSTRVLEFFRRRSPSVRPHCDVQTLREQIEQCLQLALSESATPDDRFESAMLNGAGGSPVVAGFAAGVSAGSAPEAGSRGAQSILGQRQDRRRARRKQPAELPWLWALKLPHASDARVVDISSTGVLIETPSKIPPGTMMNVELVGPEMSMNVPARMLRAHVADVDSLGVRYRVAAAFVRQLDMPGLDGGIASRTGLASVGEVLKRLTTSVDRAGGAADVVGAFEVELRRVFSVRDVQIRRTPVVVDPGAESVYFTVPTGSDAPPILQVIFDQGHAPSEMEFRALKAAANLAAAVIALAPSSDSALLQQRLTA
jgi:CheY-like chemotaxis protein